MIKRPRILAGCLAATLALLWSPQTVETSGAGGVFVPTTAPPLMPRWGHTATLLADGDVLIVGGNNGGNPWTQAERYDPDTDSFFLDSATSTARYRHTATLLADGKVLVVGGLTYGSTVTNTMEVYDPVTRSFTSVAPMSTPRFGHTATLLQNGKVLIAGGQPTTTYITNSAEIYDPVANTVSPLPTLFTPRAYHTATLLQDGRVLIAGGRYNTSAGPYYTLNSAELYDVAAGTHTGTASGMGSRRQDHTATLLDDGRVLVVGGSDGSYMSASADLYDPGTGLFDHAAALANRGYHTATLLADGQVLVAGGFASTPTSAQVYDTAAGFFTATGSMASARVYHTATRLADGQVLVTGGTSPYSTPTQYSYGMRSGELFRIPPPPTADAGSDQYLTGNDLGEAAVTLTGTATSELPFDVTWVVDGVVVGTTLTLEATVDLGTHVAELSVTDSAGRTATDTAVIAVSLPALIPGPPGPPGTVPSGALILVLQGDPAPFDATLVGKYFQALDADESRPGNKPRVVIVEMYRKN